jgi:hypothetical protein
MKEEKKFDWKIYLAMMIIEEAEWNCYIYIYGVEDWESTEKITS